MQYSNTQHPKKCNFSGADLEIKRARRGNSSLGETPTQTLCEGLRVIFAWASGDETTDL